MSEPSRRLLDHIGPHRRYATALFEDQVRRGEHVPEQLVEAVVEALTSRAAKDDRARVVLEAIRADPAAARDFALCVIEDEDRLEAERARRKQGRATYYDRLSRGTWR